MHRPLAALLVVALLVGLLLFACRVSLSRLQQDIRQAHAADGRGSPALPQPTSP